MNDETPLPLSTLLPSSKRVFIEHLPYMITDHFCGRVKTNIDFYCKCGDKIEYRAMLVK